MSKRNNDNNVMIKMEGNNKLYLCCNEDKLFDFNYRYKTEIPKFTTITKKGTKITIFENEGKIAKYLGISENLLSSILAIKLSCKLSYDSNLQTNYLKGEYDKDEMKFVIYEFMKDYLICKNCDCPEIIVKYQNKKLEQNCKACGYIRKVSLSQLSNKMVHLFAKQFI